MTRADITWSRNEGRNLGYDSTSDKSSNLSSYRFATWAHDLRAGIFRLVKSVLRLPNFDDGGFLSSLGVCQHQSFGTNRVRFRLPRKISSIIQPYFENRGQRKRIHRSSSFEASCSQKYSKTCIA